LGGFVLFTQFAKGDEDEAGDHICDAAVKTTMAR